MTSSTGRPTPLRTAAAAWSKILAPVGGVLTALVTAGTLSVDQGAAVGNGFTALDLLVSAVVGLVTAGTTIAGAFRTARTGEKDVTPSSDPRVRADNGELIPLVPRIDSLGGV